MEFLKVFLVVAIFLGSATAQVSKTEVAVSELRKSHPSLKWKSESATVADFTCDGKPDTVVLGFENKDVVIGIVSGVLSDQNARIYFSGPWRYPEWVLRVPDAD